MLNVGDVCLVNATGIYAVSLDGVSFTPPFNLPYGNKVVIIRDSRCIGTKHYIVQSLDQNTGSWSREFDMAEQFLLLVTPAQAQPSAYAQAFSQAFSSLNKSAPIAPSNMIPPPLWGPFGQAIPAVQKHAIEHTEYAYKVPTCECGSFKTYGAKKGSALHITGGRGIKPCPWAAK